MLNGAMLVWFVLTATSLLFVIWDSVTNAPTSWVQRVAWILVVAYTGVVGLVFYLLACRRPFPGGHDDYTRAQWKQGVNSEMHCLAGDATGIVVAASIVPAFELANGWDITIEYLAGFVSGLFIFQALMMIGMYQGNYLKAVRKTFFAETVSMNMVMAGMIPTMVLLTAAWPESDAPSSPAFWFRMSLATIIGGVIAFPINWWLVKNHLKHGCMTLPGRDEPAPHLGHRSPESEPPMAPQHDRADHEMHGMAMPEHEQMPGMAMSGHEHAHQGHEGHEKHQGHETHQGHAGHGMTMRDLSLPVAAAWIVGTFVVLLVAIFVTAQLVPIHFTKAS